MTTTSMLAYPTAVAITFDVTGVASGAWRASTAVDNTSNLYMDATFGGVIQNGATTNVAGETIDIYLYASWDGTLYTAGVTGTDADYTADGEEGGFHFVHSIVVDATDNAEYVWGPFNVLSVLGHMPPKWGVVIENNCTPALHATGTNNDLKYTGLKYASA
jgi:hypothetical protein